MRDGATFAGDVRLRGAKVGGQIDMTKASFGKTLTADSLSVERSLIMRDGATFAGDVRLLGAKVGGQIDMTKASFGKTLNADNLSVAGDLYMRDGATFAGDVILRGAKVGGQLRMIGTSFGKTLNAERLSVGQSLIMRDGARFAGDVMLSGAKVDGQIDMTKASFGKTLTADSLSVGRSLIMRDGATFAGDVVLSDAKISSLFLNRAIAARLDLTGTDVAHELNIADLGWRCADDQTTAVPRHWGLGDLASQHIQCDQAPTTPSLILRNVHADSLQDSSDAWPPDLDLEGFRYERLGGFFGTKARDLRARSSEQWAGWLVRNRVFSTQPYTQLASVLMAAGHRDIAEYIQYAGRERERQEAWQRGDWRQWIWLTTLCVAVGYGIGLYTFRVLWCVLVLTGLGAAVLWFSPHARRRGLAWRLGASLHRLLPVVELNKEFKDFFDNPPTPHAYEKRNLSRFQVAFFSGLALIGWVLGFFLIAAIGGLMPKG
jgi:hypothetical protein